jgi:hypothetical protein
MQLLVILQQLSDRFLTLLFLYSCNIFGAWMSSYLGGRTQFVAVQQLDEKT